MAKGQSQAANKQLATTNQIGAQQGQEAQTLENSLIPTYTSMLTEGYTPEQQAGMTTAAEGAVGSSFGDATQQAQNTAARTNNASNLTTQQDQLAAEKGLTEGEVGAGLQKSFADQQQQNQKFGAQGLENLFGANQQSANQMYGLGPGTLNARAAGQNTGLAIAGDILGGAGAAIGA